jgi:RDD family
VTAYAGIVTRTIALAIDALVLNLGIAVVAAIVGLALSVFGERISDPPTPALLGAAACWALVAGAYFAGFWSLASQTPGMRALGLEISCVGGGRLRAGRSVRRSCLTRGARACTTSSRAPSCATCLARKLLTGHGDPKQLLRADQVIRVLGRVVDVDLDPPHSARERVLVAVVVADRGRAVAAEVGRLVG